MTSSRRVFVLLLLGPQLVAPLLLYGCSLSEDLCEDGETCVNDGLFGQCWAPDSNSARPSVLPALDEAQLELLQLEISRLANEGYEWPDQKAQCVFAYFKLTMAYELQYDPTFCEVRAPANIWALIQLVDMSLKEQKTGLEEVDDGVVMEKRSIIELPDDYVDEQEIGGGQEPSALEELLSGNDAVILEPIDGSEIEVLDEPIENLIRDLNEPPPEIEEDELLLLEPSLVDPVVQEAIEEVLEGRNPDLSSLSDAQLDSLITTVYALRLAHENNATESTTGEAEEAIPLETVEGRQVDVLKKDKEHVGETNLGLENVEHKIVKGTPAVSRVVGNRVYLKVNIKEESQLYPLIEFLQNTIALPNGLLFDDFNFEDGQLSLRISRIEDVPKTDKAEKVIDSVEGVAKAVYKRRKDIARLSGAEVAETGIGIGQESVPVESVERDWLLVPLLFVCAFTITALVSVLGVHIYRQRSYYKGNITSLGGDLEAKAGQEYQELCRQRMLQDTDRPTGSKHSSTSSWCEEGTSQPSIDISTGHVLLNFLQEYINDSKRMEAQWQGLQTYRNESKSRDVGLAHANLNRAVTPYDVNLVRINGEDPDESPYLNASFIYDDDPRQPLYIAAQSPIGNDGAATWWSAVWQHDMCLIVNLSTMEEAKTDGIYWPEHGSTIYGAFEVHLVSEHIWSDDYIVRSFYLKNLKNAQTRTITQFHYLSWKRGEVPITPKTLLEFRRKVNRSYRGRAAPILVHSNQGAGRTGTYSAIDMLCARIQRGVKEIDVVASVEHLRDQRESLVSTEAQFKFIYASVAQEVSSLIKTIPQ
ncbi:unnamed protein product, partial [Mesorhabditis belari]|uniref:Receptor-type tyrosine-protein phosphatase N2 n=1 Tax=Mesorhabditis belari TaxID=2138241 RepID=A0AAF3E9Q3_9BILA